MRKKRVLSGVQPTGNLHIGNYLGAVRNWVVNQEQYENFFCIVDLHAITDSHDPQKLRTSTYEIAALYLACGIDIDHAAIFVQSHVRPHTQLTWLLNCVTPLTWLERMIQFKEKAVKQGEMVSVGLVDYPVLMASDILLYQADLVPVGEDQRQHLELCRDIAGRFNRLFASNKHPVFKLPAPLIGQAGARVMSLTDGSSKMSKSDPSDWSRINLLDSPELIQKKINKCKTDCVLGLTFDDPARPESTNLLSIYQIFSGKTKEQVSQECAELSFAKFKPLLAEAIVEGLKPVQSKYQQVMSDQAYLQGVLKKGREQAAEVAEQTLAAAQEAMGITAPL